MNESVFVEKVPVDKLDHTHNGNKLVAVQDPDYMRCLECYYAEIREDYNHLCSKKDNGIADVYFKKQESNE